MQRKKIIKKLGLIFIGILFFQTSFSQENYLPGYVIKPEGDTLHGFIDYRNREENPNKISFKGEIVDKPIVYKPIDIIKFSVQDEIYVSGIINSETSPSKTERLQEDPTIHLKIDTTFLQTLFKGNKCLYYYKSPDGKENYYIKTNATFELLVYKRYLKKQEGTRVITENKRYLGQLMLYLNDCPSIQSKLQNTSYSHESMEALFRFYHECTQSDIVFQKKVEKTPIEKGLLAGVSLSSLQFRSEDFAYLADAGFNQSTNFSTGLFFDVILPKNQGKWSINNELLFSSYKVTGQYEEFENENNYSVTKTEISYSYLKINNFLRFKYPVGKLHVYINGGISNGYAVSATNLSIFYTTEMTDEGKALNDARKYEQGYIIGSGLKYNKYSFEIRYEKGNGMSEYISLKSTTNRYYFLFGYRF